MRWVYKIWSGYDGFRPNQIPNRMNDAGRLVLGWGKYLDQAYSGDDVWVWFFGPGAYQPGVYAKGIIESVDIPARQIVLHVQEWSDRKSLTLPTENATLAEVVKPRFRQVFILPETFRRVDNCTARRPGAPSCAQRQCDYCPYWDTLPRIGRGQLNLPDLLAHGEVEAFAPAYWVIGRRSFVWNNMGRARAGVRESSEMFYRFKAGEEALAYPLARGVAHSLAARRLLDFDAIVPVPLSPEKLRMGEIHRTLLLARSLALLTRKPVWEALQLTAPMGKRAAVAAGHTHAEFRRDYAGSLKVDSGRLAGAETILLLDDVCTYGLTFRATVDALRTAGVTARIVAASAGQMTIRAAVRSDSAVFKRSRRILN